MWRLPAARAQGFLQRPAPLLWHRPVHELHWIENTTVKNRNVCLTFFTGAVQHTRSLTVSKVSRLVVSPGLKRAHIGHRRTWKSSAKPATAVAGEQGRRSLDARAQAPASPPGTAVPWRNQAWRQRRRRGLGSKTLQVLEGRETDGPSAGGNPAPGHSGRSESPDGLPAANWQAC